MKYLATATTSFLFLAIVSPMVAQEETPSNYEHLKMIGFLVGDWRAESSANKDSPDGKIKKGQKLEMQLSMRWTAGKNAIQNNLTIKVDKVVIFQWTKLMGWNARDKKIISGGFDSKGGSAMGVWHRKGDDWHIKAKGVDGNGKEISQTTVLSEITDNSFVSQAIHRMRDGEKLPDGEKILVKRVK